MNNTLRRDTDETETIITKDGKRITRMKRLYIYGREEVEAILGMLNNQKDEILFSGNKITIHSDTRVDGKRETVLKIERVEDESN